MMLHTYREELAALPVAQFLLSPDGVLVRRVEQHWEAIGVPQGWFQHRVGDHLTDDAVIGWSVMVPGGAW